jgi:aminopeptidase N
MVARGEHTPRHSFDILNYTLDLDLYDNFTSPYPKSFAASNIIHFRVDTALNRIKLNAVSTSLQIDSVGLAGISFEHENDTLYIDLDQVYNQGDSAEVKIYYQHKNVSDEAFYAAGGYVFTDCEPQGARKWFPCWDHPSDKATLDLTAKVPDEVKLGSNGRLADSLHVLDTIWYNWISRDPVATYIIVITARLNYNLDIVYWPRLSNPDDSLPIRFYYNPGENPSNIKNLIIPLATFYAETYGDHPFEKDGFATLNSQFTWGGMENQTLTSLCPGCWGEMLVAHEFAHQWFGDMITCGSWADLWLNEGFATYSEALWLEHKNGYSAYKDEIDNNANWYLASNPGWAISNPSWAFNPPDNNTLFNYAITYLKSSCLLHLFRYVTGDSLFFECIRQYAADTADFRYQTAVSVDFVAKMNEVTGQDYSWFFNQWLYHPDHPVYENTYNFTEVGNGNWRVAFRARQVQETAPFFKMPLELRIIMAGGADTIIRVMNTQNNQLFEFYFDKEPLLFFFDTDDQIVLKEASTVVGTEEIQGSSSPLEFALIPNPAEGSSVCRFYIPEDSFVRLSLLDSYGRIIGLLKNEKMCKGDHEFRIGTGSLQSGVYFIRMEAGVKIATAMLMVI